MAVKDVPISYKTYFKLMKERTYKEIKELNNYIEITTNDLDKKHKDISNNIELYKNLCNVDITKYNEFVNNKYSTGNFLKLAKGLFTNRSNNYELVSDLFDLYSFANTQKKLYEAKNKLKFKEKLNNITLKEYNNILRTFYTEVHKQLILEGNGYAFYGRLGWICINRCVIKNKKKLIDFAATKQREKELKAQGKRIYNKEEADWCKRNGIEYKAEDKRVYKNAEYCYEVPLISCKLPNGTLLKLEVSDYRHTSIRGKTNNDLLKECNNDIRKICELPVDIKTKVNLCDSVDKILYTKFIRNEAQKPAINRTLDR